MGLSRMGAKGHPLWGDKTTHWLCVAQSDRLFFFLLHSDVPAALSKEGPMPDICCGQSFVTIANIFFFN